MTANPSTLRYPCGYHLATEICVTASDQNDQRWSSANYGATAVDLVAPGVNVYSTLRNDSYGYISGGSMASPQVAGTAALVLSRQDMTITDLKADILDHVDPLPSLNGVVRTGGRVDVCKALPGCPGAPLITSPADGSYTNSAKVTLSGSAEAGSSIEVFDGSTSKGIVTTDSSERWSDPMAAVAGGEHSYAAKATVAGASTSAASAPVRVTVDTHVPMAPSITSPADGNYNSTGNVTLSGSAEADSTVTVHDGKVSEGVAATNSTGNWSKSLRSVPDGPHAYTATATDRAGTSSSASNPAVRVTVNTQEPVAPSSPATSLAPNSPAPAVPASPTGPRTPAPFATSQADMVAAARASIRALARTLAHADPFALLRLGGPHPLAMRWPEAGRYWLSWTADARSSATERARGHSLGRRAALRVFLIGRGAATRTTGGPGGLALRLTGAGRRYLRMVKTGRTLLRATFQPANGTQATTVSVVVIVAVRPKPRSHKRY